MRTLLLIVLGLGLVVFLTLRKDPENTAVSEASADGVMLAEEGVVRAAPPPEPEAAPASATASAGPAGPAQAPAQAAQPAAPAEAPQPAAGSAPAAAPALLAPDSAEELELAQELAHRPDSLASWLGKRPELERSARGEFASALAMAVLGRGEAASAMLERLERSGGVQAAELLALRALLSTQSARPVPASASAPSALVHAADLARAVREGRDALSRGEHASSVRAYSAALRAEIDAPWAADPRQLGEWTEALRRAQAQHQWSPRGSWKALEISVQNGDSLIAIRKRALAQSEGLTTCTGLIAKANGLRNEAAIHPGMKLRVPTDKPEVLVDLSARWILFFLGENVVCSYPVGIGRQGSETPVGSYRIGEKTSEPTWFPPGAAPVPFNDPRNPLGTRWMAWQSEGGSNTSLGFHGTREPSSIGQQGSEGCIRLLNSDVEELFELLPRGTPVRVQP
jgi:nucleoid-associated protein YgaU